MVISVYRKAKIAPSIIAILLVSIIGLLVLSLLRSAKSRRDFSGVDLSARYPDGYVAKVVRIGDSLIGYAYNTGGVTADQWFPDHNIPPVVFLRNEQSGEQVYEIDLVGAGYTINTRFDVFDADSDGINEVLSEWEAHAGGSGGLKGLIVWKVDEEDGLIPLAGYPQEVSDEAYENGFIIKDLGTGQALNLLPTSIDFFTEYDFETEPFRLWFARYIWDPSKSGMGESHLAPHTWKLRVFKFEGDSFVVDKSWNNGKEYTTEKKIPVDEAGFQELREIFYSRSTEKGGSADLLGK